MTVISVCIAYILAMVLYIAGVLTGIINLPFLVLLAIEGVIFLICVQLMRVAISFEIGD